MGSCEEACRPPPEELECQICCHAYSASTRRPKVLGCLHRVCTQCLLHILDLAEGAAFISCPFCRHPTPAAGWEVSALPDDANIMSHLALRGASRGSDRAGELLLTPKSFSCSSSPDSFGRLVVTVSESSSGGSAVHEGPASSGLCRRVPRSLAWLLGFLYFGSLPLGIYLLVLQEVTLGVVGVALVPASLTVCLLYEFCGVRARTCAATPDSVRERP